MYLISIIERIYFFRNFFFLSFNNRICVIPLIFISNLSFPTKYIGTLPVILFSLQIFCNLRIRYLKFSIFYWQNSSNINTMHQNDSFIMFSHSSTFRSSDSISYSLFYDITQNYIFLCCIFINLTSNPRVYYRSVTVAF